MVRTQSREETMRLGEALANTILEKGVGSAAVLVLLEGDLGSGKTTFAQGLAKALGVEHTVVSPTFVIERVYELRHLPFEQLVHIDAYRLPATDTLETIAFAERLKNSKNIILLEWPNQVSYPFPSEAYRVSFAHVSEHERDVSMT